MPEGWWIVKTLINASFYAALTSQIKHILQIELFQRKFSAADGDGFWWCWMTFFVGKVQWERLLRESKTHKKLDARKTSSHHRRRQSLFPHVKSSLE